MNTHHNISQLSIEDVSMIIDINSNKILDLFYISRENNILYIIRKL